MNELIISNTKTMSSTEIAQLTGKQKTHIHRDIKDQLFIGLYGLKGDPILDDEQIQGLTITLDNRGYWSEVLLDRYHTDIIISGYEVKYRAAIVKRWHELENKPLTIVDYARALVKSHDRIQALEKDQEITNIAISDLRSDVRWIEDRLEKEIENKKLYGWKN